MPSIGHVSINGLWLVLGGSTLIFILYMMLADPTQSDYVPLNHHKPKRPPPMGTGPIFGKTPFQQKIVHFDLKGAAPRVEFLAQIFPWIRRMGATGVILEYEDQFPWADGLIQLRTGNSYTPREIQQINALAEESHLELIPLTQTFGHLEFVLKRAAFSALSEDALERNTICPSTNETYELLDLMLRNIRAAHPNSNRIHIGSDEAYHVGEDDRCRNRMSNYAESSVQARVERLKVEHVSRVANLSRSAGFSEVLAWNDMFDKTDVNLMQEFRLGDLITPVLWGYSPDVTAPGYFSDGLLKRLSLAFPKFYVAGAWKGANGAHQTYLDSAKYTANLLSYVRLLRENATDFSPNQLSGVILTGWSRYAHGRPLCELTPVGLPSLALLFTLLTDVDASTSAVNQKARRHLSCVDSRAMRDHRSVRRLHASGMAYFPPAEAAFSACAFPAHKVYALIEELRYAQWAVGEWRRMNSTATTAAAVLQHELRAKLRRKLQALTDELRELAANVLYEATTHEFYLQNIAPLFEALGKEKEHF